MAQTFYTNTDKAISFDEFIETLSHRIKYGDLTSLTDCAEPLFQIANNQTFFADYLNRALSGLSSGKYLLDSEQSYVLYSCKVFYVRVTYWPVVSNKIEKRKSQYKLFSYDLVHDHNFALLTAGYRGDGYTTKLWEYDYDKVTGYVNEKVDIRFLEETTLSPGKALYYRPSQDIHSQYAPKQEDSLAINIVLRSDHIDNRQYCFDIENNTVSRIFYGARDSRFGLLKLATKVGNTDTFELIEQLGKRHPIPQIRQESLMALSQVVDPEYSWRLGLSDEEKSVRNFSKLHLNALEQEI